MHIRLIGDPHEVTGFALAGVEGTDCHTRVELIAALDEATHDPGVAIVVVSPGAASLAADVIDSMRDRRGLPITIVLPDLPESERVAALERA